MLRTENGISLWEAQEKVPGVVYTSLTRRRKSRTVDCGLVLWASQKLSIRSVWQLRVPIYYLFWYCLHLSLVPMTPALRLPPCNSHMYCVAGLAKPEDSHLPRVEAEVQQLPSLRAGWSHWMFFCSFSLDSDPQLQWIVVTVRYSYCWIWS